MFPNQCFIHNAHPRLHCFGSLPAWVDEDCCVFHLAEEGLVTQPQGFWRQGAGNDYEVALRRKCVQGNCSTERRGVKEERKKMKSYKPKPLIFIRMFYNLIKIFNSSVPFHCVSFSPFFLTVLSIHLSSVGLGCSPRVQQPLHSEGHESPSNGHAWTRTQPVIHRPTGLKLHQEINITWC